MKKIVLSLFVSVAISLQGFSQAKMVIPEAQYQALKASGKLKPDVQYIPVGDVHPTPMTTKAKETISTMKQPHPKSNANCSCFIQGVDTDPTFSIAEFTNGVAPEYRNDDGSTPIKTIPFNFCLYGTPYTQLYINNNGNITFGQTYSTFTGAAFPSASIPAMVAPFWGDVDTRNTASGLVYYKITPTYMIVQWKNVGYYSNMTDYINNFQLIITDGTDPILPSGNNIAFCYGDMQWTTGAASGGVGGFGGTASTVGINKGDGVNYLQMGRFDQPGIAYDGGYGNNDGISWLDYQSMYFNVCSSTNIAPIASGLNNCDTIKVCGTGDTLVLDGLFLSPEIGQITNILVNLNGMSGATVISNTSGNSADAIVQIIAGPGNAGYRTITFTATDNGSPVGTTVVNAHLFIDTTGLSAFNPHITGNLEFCQGSTTTLSVSPTTYDSYVWSTGSVNTSITVDTSGVYWVTSTLNNCQKSSLVNVVEHLSPTPVIAGYPFTCSTTGTSTTNLYSDSLIYASYSWSSGSINDSIQAGNGVYTLTVTDQYGCTATSAPVTVTGPLPPVITGTTAVCNGQLAQLTTTFAYVSYDWSNGATVSTNDTATVPASPPSYTVTVVDQNGCVLTSAPFTVNNFNFAVSVTGIHPFCAGQSITVTAGTNNATQVPSYLWSNSATTSAINLTSGGTYTVTLTYPNGCTSDTTVTVAPPNPLPAPTVTGSLFTCGSTPTTLTVSPITAGSTYVWSGTSSTNSSISVLSGLYSLTETDVNGCVGNSSVYQVTNQNPLVTIQNNAPFCPGASINLTANPTIPSGVNYLWSNTETTQSTTVASSGVYSVTVSYSNGCTAADTVTVSQFSTPVANFTESPLGTCGANVPVVFQDLSTVTGGSISSWVWNFGDTTGVYHLGAHPTHTYAVNGTYPVTLAVQSSNGCWDTIRMVYEVISDLEYPNVFTPNDPGVKGVNQYLYFKNLEYFPNTELTVYNRWGIKVYNNKDYHNDWNGGMEHDGTYYYVLSGPKMKEPKYGFVEIIR
ncbi:MAG: nidogen-like domain-containing protein [Bacteroidota bacterium]